MLTNLIPSHGFMKNKNSTVILLFCTRLVEYYLEKGFVIIEHNFKNLSIILNKLEQRIHAFYMNDLDYVMACYISIAYVENTIKKLRIVSALHSGYIHNLYHNKKESIDDLFCHVIRPKVLVVMKVFNNIMS